MEHEDSNCPLCLNPHTSEFSVSRWHTYHHCKKCDLVFALKGQLLNQSAERSRYEEHNNDPSDLGYREFLNRVVKPLTEKISKDAEGLDFGCGPGPTISVMLNEQGINCENYDPLFFPETSLLEKQYDFITCTEACEHFYHPAKEFELLFSMLRPSGHLGVMTETRIEGSDFSKWYYKDDPTHVCFYSDKTFEWLSKKYNVSFEKVHKNAFIFQMKG